VWKVFLTISCLSLFFLVQFVTYSHGEFEKSNQIFFIDRQTFSRCNINASNATDIPHVAIICIISNTVIVGARDVITSVWKYSRSTYRHCFDIFHDAIDSPFYFHYRRVGVCIIRKLKFSWARLHQHYFSFKWDLNMYLSLSFVLNK